MNAFAHGRGQRRPRLFRSAWSELLASLMVIIGGSGGWCVLNRYWRRHRPGKWRILGVIAGVLLFIGITSQADPASAQLFDTVESEAESIFGEYLEGGIIGFMFGLLRIVVWVSAVGFIFFAVYQAQRGEQWQPLLQNAFIIVAAIVIVEGLSRLFFGTA